MKQKDVFTFEVGVTGDYPFRYQGTVYHTTKIFSRHVAASITALFSEILENCPEVNNFRFRDDGLTKTELESSRQLANQHLIKKGIVL